MIQMNEIPTSVASMITSILSDCQHSQNQTWINRALNLVKWMVWAYPDMEAEIIPAEVEKKILREIPTI